MEKKTSLSSSTIWYSAGNFLIRSISFILLPLYTHVLSTADYGNYALLLSVYALAAVLYQSGMQSALTKFYLDETTLEGRSRVFSSIFNSAVLLGVFLTAAAALFSGSISFIILGTQNLSGLIILVFTALLFDSICYYGLQLLKTQEKAKIVVRLSFINAIINFILNIVLVYFMRMSIAGIFYAQLISAVILLLLLFPNFSNEYKIYIDKKVIKLVVIFSLPLFVSGLLSSAVDVSDRFILNFYTNRNEVGIYSLSYKIAMVMNVFMIAFRTAWIPHAIKVYKQGNYSKIFGKTFEKLLLGSFLILLIVVLFSPALFEIKLFSRYLFNPDYKSGIIILPFVLTGYMLNGIAGFYSLYPFISSKSIHFLLSDASAFIMNILLNLILIPKFGMLGAAAATAIAFLASALYLFIISRKKIVIAYPLKEIMLIGFTAVIFMIIGVYFSNYIINLALILFYVLIFVKQTKFNIKDLFSFSNSSC